MLLLVPLAEAAKFPTYREPPSYKGVSKAPPTKPPPPPPVPPAAVLSETGGKPDIVVDEAGTGGLKPYLLVRGRLEALVTRALCYDLFEIAATEAGRGPGLWSAGAFFPLEAGTPRR